MLLSSRGRGSEGKKEGDPARSERERESPRALAPPDETRLRVARAVDSARPRAARRHSPSPTGVLGAADTSCCVRMFPTASCSISTKGFACSSVRPPSTAARPSKSLAAGPAGSGRSASA
eukprot:13275108-Alexandrium_andersonii.AAC.1